MVHNHMRIMSTRITRPADVATEVEVIHLCRMATIQIICTKADCITHTTIIVIITDLYHPKSSHRAVITTLAGQPHTNLPDDSDLSGIYLLLFLNEWVYRYVEQQYLWD